MTVATTLISFFFVLGVLVFVHELGHFLVAKKAGIRVEQFSLGYPPKAVGVTIGETEYCLSWLPLGGYVKVAGMADFGHETSKGESWEFQSQPRWIQMSVMVAGPAMNFVLAFLLILGVRLGAGEYAFMASTRVGKVEATSSLHGAGLLSGDRILTVGGEVVTDWEELSSALESRAGHTVTVGVERGADRLSLDALLDQKSGLEPYIPAGVGTVLPGNPAEGIGLKSGDRIVGVDGVRVAQWFEMSREISARPGQEFELQWVRDGVEMSAMITPRSEEVDGKIVGRIGIGMPMDRVPVSFGKAVTRSGTEMVRLSTAIFGFVKRLVSGQESGRSLAGPVAIAQMAGQSAEQGWEPLFSFMALLSVNLAVLNLLPIPMLDGGHLTILTVEAIIRRELSVRQKEVLQQMGFAFLLMLMIYVTFSDILRIFG